MLLNAIPLFTVAVLLAASRPAQAQPWVTAYLAGWEVSQNGVVPASIDLNSVTDLVWFSLVPTSSGTIVESSGDPGINADASTVATAAHNAGKKVLISIGGAGTEPDFDAAFNAGDTSALVNSIVSWVSSNNYDGVDIDDEPLQPADSGNYQTFIKDLRAALPSSKVLTAAVEPFGAAPSTFGPIASSFNQINIMTYDMIYGNGLSNGSGEMTWYNSPISSGSNYEQTGPAMPSISSALKIYESSPVSITASKLGIGAAFYGYDFSGATNIMQAYTGTWPPPALSYTTIITNSSYYNSSYYHYDSTCNAAYISRTDTGNFITYDDPTAVAAKISYVGSNSLGGLVAFEIGQQYDGGANPLLKAIDGALGSSGGGAGGSGTIANGYWYMAPACATGSRLDDPSGATANGAKLQIWQDADNANQKWNFANVGANQWNMAVIGPYCLYASGTTSGSAAEIWTCNGSNAEKIVSSVVSGGYNFAEYGYALCLDVSGAGNANGTAVQFYTCNGTSAQNWALDTQ